MNQADSSQNPKCLICNVGSRFYKNYDPEQVFSRSMSIPSSSSIRSLATPSAGISVVGRGRGSFVLVLVPLSVLPAPLIIRVAVKSTFVIVVISILIMLTLLLVVVMVVLRYSPNQPAAAKCQSERQKSLSSIPSFHLVASQTRRVGFFRHQIASPGNLAGQVPAVLRFPQAFAHNKAQPIQQLAPVYPRSPAERIVSFPLNHDRHAHCEMLTE